MTDRWDDLAERLLDGHPWIDEDIPRIAIATALRTAYEAGKAEERERCVALADDYATVNREIASDTILLDPVLRGRGLTPENVAEYERQQINGTIHSAMFHAAQNIAAAIRGI